MRLSMLIVAAVFGLGLASSTAHAGPGDIEFDDQEVSCTIAVGSGASGGASGPLGVLAGLVALGAVVRRKRGG